MFIVKFLAKPRRAREGGYEAAGDGGHGVDMKVRGRAYESYIGIFETGAGVLQDSP